MCNIWCSDKDYVKSAQPPCMACVCRGSFQPYSANPHWFIGNLGCYYLADGIRSTLWSVNPGTLNEQRISLNTVVLSYKWKCPYNMFLCVCRFFREPFFWWPDQHSQNVYGACRPNSKNRQQTLSRLKPSSANFEISEFKKARCSFSHCETGAYLVLD